MVLLWFCFGFALVKNKQNQDSAMLIKYTIGVGPWLLLGWRFVGFALAVLLLTAVVGAVAVIVCGAIGAVVVGGAVAVAIYICVRM